MGFSVARGVRGVEFVLTDEDDDFGESSDGLGDNFVSLVRGGGTATGVHLAEFFCSSSAIS